MHQFKGFIIVGFSFCSALLLAQDQQVGMTPTAGASQPLLQLPAEEAAHFQFGLGYPDLRLRFNVSGPVDAEAKVAFGQGIAAYSGRIYLKVYSLDSLSILIGGEAGFLSFSGVDTLDGNGGYGEVFLGAQYRFLKKWTALVDFGPSKIEISSEGQNYTKSDWIVNTAIYYTLF